MEPKSQGQRGLLSPARSFGVITPVTRGGGGGGVPAFLEVQQDEAVAPEPAQHCRGGADVPHGRHCRSGTARNCRTNILSRSQMKEHHLETLAACGNDCISMCAFWAIYKKGCSSFGGLHLARTIMFELVAAPCSFVSDVQHTNCAHINNSKRGSTCKYADALISIFD